MSRNARRIAVSLGTAAGAALIAASFSLGNAPVAGADVLGADAVSDLLAASAAEALPAAGVSNTLALSYLIEAFDPNSFNATGQPTDALGLFGFYTDTYFLGPTGLDAELAPLVQQLVGTVAPGTPGTYTPEISLLIFAIDPEAFTSATTLTPTDPLGEQGYFTDTYLFGPFGIDNLIAPYIQEIIASLPAESAASVDVSPVADLVAGLDPGAVGAGATDLTAPVIEGLLNSF